MKYKFGSLRQSLSLTWMAVLALYFLIYSCEGEPTNEQRTRPGYVSPSINYKGQFRKGYVRKSVSINKNALRSQIRSKYYYETRGKYRRRK